MDEISLRRLLDRFAAGDLDAAAMVEALRRLPYADLGFARVDHHRVLRQGIPEAVYAPGKTPDQCAAIVVELLQSDGPVLLTRADDDQVAAALAAEPTGQRHGSTVAWRPAPSRAEAVVVVTAGTADLPVADEAVPSSGVRVRSLLARRLRGGRSPPPPRPRDALAHADAVVVVAGMEGALASVVGGLTAGAGGGRADQRGLRGVARGGHCAAGDAGSCASGMVVVGIDNGFGAACAVARDRSARRPTGASEPCGPWPARAVP